jgi:hypothetical protein
MRVLLLGSIVVGLPGCIEGEERDSVHNIEPRVCETGLRTDQAFVIDGSYKLERQQRLQTDPPRFELDGPTGTIAIAVIAGEYGEMTLVPDAPLPPDSDFTLRLVDPGALDDAYIPPMFPARYSTRTETTIRTYRATYRNIFVSFSQPLDAATVTGAVSVQRSGAPASAAVEYVDAPGHVVHVTVYDDAEVDVLFGPSLRTKAGSAIFEAQSTIRVDPAYTLPAQNGCEHAE